ncbi:MAG: hypothetical protein ABI651_18555, partial [Verrucomicrobiota bacterium]
MNPTILMTGYPERPGATKIVDWPASYHNKSGGLSFADGHSEIKRWSDGRTTRPLIINGTLQDQQPRHHLAARALDPQNKGKRWIDERTMPPIRPGQSI